MILQCPVCHAVLYTITCFRSRADVRERSIDDIVEQYSVGTYCYITLRCGCGSEQEIELYASVEMEQAVSVVPQGLLGGGEVGVKAESCNTCLWFRRGGGVSHPGGGRCLAEPPTLVRISERMGPRWEHPAVSGDNVCRHWREIVVKE